MKVAIKSKLTNPFYHIHCYPSPFYLTEQATARINRRACHSLATCYHDLEAHGYDVETFKYLLKDTDFRHLLDHFGPPPQVLWLTCGNTSNERLQEVLRATLPPPWSY